MIPSPAVVTGADGFIGSHLAEALVAAGVRVRALVQYNALSSAGWLDSIAPEIRDEMEIVSGDIRDGDAMFDLLAGARSVFHLAALIAIPYSYRAAASYVDANIHGTLNLLQAARRRGVEIFVQTSTSEVYGSAQRVPIDETHPLNAQSPYAATKIASDQMALAHHRSFGLPVVVLRPFNTYGPRQSARAVIPTVMIQVLAGHRRIRLGALDPTRDFSHVADTVAGFLAAAEAPAAIGEVVNLGSGFEISVGDTARLIAEAAGTEIEIVADSDRMRPAASEVERLLADTTKAHRLLDWRPRYGGRDGFRKGLEHTLTWFADPANAGRYRPDVYNV